MSEAKPRSKALIAIDLLFALAVILLPIVWLWGRIVFVDNDVLTVRVSWGPRPIVFLMLMLILRIVFWQINKRKDPPAKGIIGNPLMGPTIFSVFLVFLGLYSWEKSLEKEGFEAEMPSIVIAGEEKKPELKSRYHFKDPELLWRWRPGVTFNGRVINQMGFLDREVNPVKTPGTTRVISMGCSCTGQGTPPYSGYLNDMLNADAPGQWDAFNMGVHGYSTSQGLRLFQNEGEALEPDVVTIFYGWNDHWRARSKDSKRMAKRASAFQAKIMEVLGRKRFFQYIVNEALPEYENVLPDKEFVLRVPHEEYRSNLQTFIEEIRAVGATPVLIAAPRKDTLSELLVLNKQTADVNHAANLHDEYLEILYEVAAETNTAVVDLPNRLSAEDKQTLMSDDGIHFKQEGLKRVAEEIYQVIQSLDNA